MRVLSVRSSAFSHIDSLHSNAIRVARRACFDFDVTREWVVSLAESEVTTIYLT